MNHAGLNKKGLKKKKNNVSAIAGGCLCTTNM